MVPPEEDALAPPELEHAGEHVAQQAEQGGPVLGKGVPASLGGGCGDEYGVSREKQVLCDQDGRHGLEHVAQDHHEGQKAAEGAVEIGEARVAAAVIAHVVPQDVLGDE